MDSSKPFYTSKTFWVNLIVALAAIFPPAQEYITAHPEVAVTVISVVNLVLRVVTKDAVTIS